MKQSKQSKRKGNKVIVILVGILIIVILIVIGFLTGFISLMPTEVDMPNQPVLQESSEVGIRQPNQPTYDTSTDTAWITDWEERYPDEYSWSKHPTNEDNSYGEVYRVENAETGEVLVSIPEWSEYYRLESYNEDSDTFIYINPAMPGYKGYMSIMDDDLMAGQTLGDVRCDMLDEMGYGEYLIDNCTGIPFGTEFIEGKGLKDYTKLDDGKWKYDYTERLPQLVVDDVIPIKDGRCLVLCWFNKATGSYIAEAVAHFNSGTYMRASLIRFPIDELQTYVEDYFAKVTL